MDRDLRQLERHRQDNPERWLLGLKRVGMIGPTNLSVLGMLGYQPAVNILGGVLRPSEEYTYWYRHWHLDMNLKTSHFGYLPKIHRIWFFAKQTVWMLEELGNLSTNHRTDQEKWLEDLENRQQFLGVLLKKI